jgi:SMI1 / KNR4 family (SUKH-1)
MIVKYKKKDNYMTNIEIFQKLKKKSEEYWSKIELNPRIYGFQVQKGTKWKEGLTKKEIENFEQILGFRFPQIYKDYLTVMNGTEKDTINIYGNSGEEFNYGKGYYSYPEDIEEIKDNINWILESFKVTTEDIVKKHIPNIIPIVSHRFLIADKCVANPILSMYGDDVILYDNALPSFIENDVFNNGRQGSSLTEIAIPFWLDLYEEDDDC